MSTLTKAQRDALPASDFGDPDAKPNRLFPIKDQDDVDSAAHLIGKAGNPDAVKRRIIAIAKRKGLKLPDAWKPANMSADFSVATPDASGENITRRGLIFRSGDFTDKNFRLTPLELVEAAEAFTEAPIDSGHPLNGSPLDGKLGRLEAVEATPDGTELFGTVTWPKWLDELVPDEERKVSVAWDRQTKRIKALSLVTEPRIDDAALMAAFAAARHDTPDGQYTIQSIHDHAARSGAVCNDPARMASRHEASAIQQVHDLCTEHGAQCSAVQKGRSSSMFARGGKGMDWLKAFKFWQAAGEPENLDPAVFASNTTAIVSGQTVAAIGGIPVPGAVPDPEKEALRAEVRRLKVEGIQKDAAAFAEHAILEHRAYPSKRESLMVSFSQAVLDDAEHGTATFGAAGMSRVEMKRAEIAARPQHQLTQELLQPGQNAQVLFNAQQSGAAAVSEEDKAKRRAELMAMTPLGRETATFAAKNGASHN